MRIVLEILKWTLFVIICFVLLGVVAVSRNELTCFGSSQSQQLSNELISEEWRRSQSAIVLSVADDLPMIEARDYARVIDGGDAYEFGYFRSVWQYWGAICSVSKKAGEAGSVEGDVKVQLYARALIYSYPKIISGIYENTLGRLLTLMNGSQQSKMEVFLFEASKARSEMLETTPWYAVSLELEHDALDNIPKSGLRDWERYAVTRIGNWTHEVLQSLYENYFLADVQFADLKTRSVVSGVTTFQLKTINGLRVMNVSSTGIEIETGKLTQLTKVAQDIVQAGGNFETIAGMSAVAIGATEPIEANEIFTFQRAKYFDSYLLYWVNVKDIGKILREHKVDMIYDG